MKSPSYYMFIDESGDASLNNPGEHFLLSSVIIKKADFEIIQGYLRLLKRKYFDDDFKLLHATDLFERPHKKYKRLWKKDTTNQFIQQLADVLLTIPYDSCVYHVDKKQVRQKFGHTPGPRRKPIGFDIDLPYELAAREAIFDFTHYLRQRKSTGEMVIESRLNKDANFVTYFDRARRSKFPDGKENSLYRDVQRSIPSLFILNKDSNNNGLEIADIVAYVVYRRTVGDPQNVMRLSMEKIDQLHAAINKSKYKGPPSSPKLVHNVAIDDL